MTAEALAHALGAQHRTGGTWLVRCPAHDDGTPSLAIAEGDAGHVVFRCHAGCEQAAVLEALRDRGLWGDAARVIPHPQRIEAARALRHAQDQERIETARRIWDRAQPAAGTLVERYLRSRSISSSAPERLRFHARLRHRDVKGEVTRWPAMVALVTDVSDRILGVHRTYLARDGRGKAPVSPNKMALGAIGGGSVRIAPLASELLVAEGLETAIAASELSRLPAWAGLSASNLARLALPELVRSILICADRDPNGTGQRAALAAARRWQDQGRAVRVLLPAPGFKDFADQLAAQRARALELAS